MKKIFVTFIFYLLISLTFFIDKSYSIDECYKINKSETLKYNIEGFFENCVKSIEIKENFVCPDEKNTQKKECIRLTEKEKENLLTAIRGISGLNNINIEFLKNNKDNYYYIKYTKEIFENLEPISKYTKEENNNNYSIINNRLNLLLILLVISLVFIIIIPVLLSIIFNPNKKINTILHEIKNNQNSQIYKSILQKLSDIKNININSQNKNINSNNYSDLDKSIKNIEKAIFNIEQILMNIEYKKENNINENRQILNRDEIRSNLYDKKHINIEKKSIIDYYNDAKYKNNKSEFWNLYKINYKLKINSRNITMENSKLTLKEVFDSSFDIFIIKENNTYLGFLSFEKDKLYNDDKKIFNEIFDFSNGEGNYKLKKAPIFENINNTWSVKEKGEINFV